MASSILRSDTPPTVYGITLVPVSTLPDRCRSVFNFPLFNAVQSKSFHHIWETDNNFVLSAPTGSGKTAIFELAICRIVSQNINEKAKFKVIYHAPTKALCAERQRDWERKFHHLGIKCVEITGDSENKQLRDIQNAEIIVTTPEKWDSVTRKWKDQKRLMELVKLFLIDEVHILKEDRGGSLEAVVSRMKSIGSKLRFIALSATLNNSDDVAIWLGKNSEQQSIPAVREVFGEEFRPVTLQKHVLGYQAHGGNDFALEHILNAKLSEVVAAYAKPGKPTLVFCSTRKSTEETAKTLSEWWASQDANNRIWKRPRANIAVNDNGVRDCTENGVAFHHAGINLSDRRAIEKAYLDGLLSVICCTSTLAVGINLPCHLVIVKNTITWQGEGYHEYSDLDIMQMLGRAGRPQFDKTATAVIMTRREMVPRYERMITGQEPLESKLQTSLIEHLNAEICLRTVFDYPSALRWLRGTFFYVRYRTSATDHGIGKKEKDKSAEEYIQSMCSHETVLLRQYALVSSEKQELKPTGFGEAMSRYCVKFETMKVILGLQSKAKISAILSALAQASEFQSIRLRAAEKQVFKDINSSPDIRYPIKHDLVLPAHKVSLIIQAVLAGLDRDDIHLGSYRQQFQQENARIFKEAHRIVRCILDCQLYREDSVAVRNTLELARSLGAGVWDDSPNQLLHVPKIGPVSMRKLVTAGIRSIEELLNTDYQRIDMILSRNPPFGANLLKQLKTFPRLRVSLKTVGQPLLDETNGVAKINVAAELGFLNSEVPTEFVKTAIFISFVAETSEGVLLHFCKMSALKLNSFSVVRFQAELRSACQAINCYVACEDIAGTQQFATLTPKIPASIFANRNLNVDQTRPKNNPGSCFGTSYCQGYEDYGIEDEDLAAAVDAGFDDIDELESSPSDNNPSKLTKQPTNPKVTDAPKSFKPTTLTLPNGKYSCNHKCKDKSQCKHLCCREGLDKPPKPSKNTSTLDEANNPVSRSKHLTKPRNVHNRITNHFQQEHSARSLSKRKLESLFSSDIDELGSYDSAATEMLEQTRSSKMNDSHSTEPRKSFSLNDCGASSPSQIDLSEVLEQSGTVSSAKPFEERKLVSTQEASYYHSGLHYSSKTSPRPEPSFPNKTSLAENNEHELEDFDYEMERLLEPLTESAGYSPSFGYGIEKATQQTLACPSPANRVETTGLQTTFPSVGAAISSSRSEPQVEARAILRRDEIDPWILEHFGDIIEFVD